MGFFEAVGFGLVLIGCFMGFCTLSFWGACTKRPVVLFFGLLSVGVLLPSMAGGQIDGNSPWMVAAVTTIFGAVGAGIFGSIQAKGIKARFLMGSALITMSVVCFLVFFGMIDIVPAEAEISRQILNVLAWSIVAPIGIMGIAEIFGDFLGVGVTASATAR